MKGFVAIFASVAAVNVLPPPVPATFPPIDQTQMIPASFIADKLVQDALAHVKSVVSAETLAIKPSVYNPATPNAPTYDAALAAKTCYWPVGACLRQTDTADYKSDIFTCPTANDWGITYDDGPTVDPAKKAGTPELITALKAANVKSTFFIVGSNAVQNPQVVKDLLDAGHQLASHTWTHHPMTSLTNEQLVAEIKYTEAIIYKAAGVVVNQIRPPYGDVDDRVRAVMTALGYRNILWSKDSQDAASANVNTAAVIETIKSWFVAGPGFISLEHDISVATTTIAIGALQAIQAAGASLPVKPQPVAQCMGIAADKWYATAGANTTSTTATNGTSTGTSTTGTTSAPKQSNKSGGLKMVGASVLFLVGGMLLL